MNEALDLAVLFVHPPIAEPPKHEIKTNKGSLQAPKTLRSAFTSMEKQDGLDSMIVNTTEAWYEAKHPEDEGGIMYNDEEIGIEWPSIDGEILLSEKDKKHLKLSESKIVFEK